jgi:hypothetical protein
VKLSVGFNVNKERTNDNTYTENWRQEEGMDTYFPLGNLNIVAADSSEILAKFDQ